MSTFTRPTGNNPTGTTAQGAGALVPGNQQDGDDEEKLGTVYGMVHEPMPIPPSYLFKVGHYMFWVGGIGIGNGGQCLTSIASMLIWQYSSPVYFLGSLAVNMGWWGWLAYGLEFLIRLIISAALAALFQFGMALIPISTTGTWGSMLATNPDARAALQGGKRRFSILIAALLIYEVIVGFANIISDNQAFSAITNDLRFRLVATALLTIATLILTPAGFILKQYAMYKMAEMEMEADEFLKTQDQDAQANGTTS